MTQTISALFDSYGDAVQAMHRLEGAGVAHDDISVVSNNSSGEHAANGETRGEHAAEDAGKGAGVGAAVGGLGGLLAGLGLMAIPGLGPVVAAGWLASTAVGAVVGGAAGGAVGGLVGALTGAGVPQEDADAYAEGVRRGGTLVTARVPDDRAAELGMALQTGGAVDLPQRRAAYQQEGWTRFDPSQPAYTSDQVQAERQRFVIR